MNPPPELTQIVESLVIASEDAMDSARIAESIAKAVEMRQSDLDEGESLPEEWERLSRFTAEDVDQAVATLNERYAAAGHAIAIVMRPRGWKIMTRPELADFLTVLYPERRTRRLSAPALETLSIIAYRQPVTKAEIESVRGVSVDGMMQKLLDLELVRIEGRAELPGRPLLYVTTGKFLEHFNLRDTNELPNIQELSRVSLPSAEEVHTDSFPAGGQTDSGTTEPAPEQAPEAQIEARIEAGSEGEIEAETTAEDHIETNSDPGTENDESDSADEPPAREDT